LPLLAIDVGTTELKASVYGDGGIQLATASAEYQPSQTSTGGLELDANRLWSTLENTTQSVTRKAGNAFIQAVAISSHGESFVPVALDGEPLGPFILNIDSRASQETAEFVQAIGRERLYEMTGLPPHPMYTLPKILWLRNHRPELFSASKKFLCIEDFILHRAGVGAYMSASLASRTMGLDLASGQWSKELLGCAGIDPELMAQILPSGKPLGTARPEIVERLNLSRDTLWVTGGHDQACGSLGGGGLWPDIAVDGTGTFESLSISLEKPLLSPMALNANLPCERHARPEHFLTLAYAPAGAVLKWFRDQCSRGAVAEARELNQNPYDLMLAHVPEDPTAIFVYPHLFGTGTPWLDANARGTIYGITSSTTYGMLAKAVLEGITYEILWNLEILEGMGIFVRRIYAVGGGAKSRTWLQLKADLFGREVVVVEGEASCVGAAICAGIGAGIYASWQEGVSDLVKQGIAYLPRPAMHERYRELFQEYKKVAQKLYGFQWPTCAKEVRN
jgi:xylulokinase